MTYRELRKLVTSAAYWDDYRETHGIASASDLTKAELEAAARALIGPDYASQAPAPAAQTPEDDDADTGDTDETPAPAKPASAPAAADPLASLRPVLAPTLLAEADKAISAIVADLNAARAERDAAKETAAFQPVASGDGGAPVVSGGSPAGAKPFKDVIGGRKYDFPVQTFTGADRVPAVDPDYLWPDRSPQIVRVLEKPDFARRHVFLFGPRGTGKTSFAEQYAARTGRPCFLIPIHADTSFADLFGFPAPEGEGMGWHPGALLVAIQTPNAVVALEEIGMGRPELVNGPLQTLLQNGTLDLAKGLAARVAPGVRIVATNNNNGADLTAGGYHGLRPLNDAFRDRFSVMAEVPYLTPAREASALVKRTGAPLDLAKALCDFAARTRKAAVAGDMESTVGFRRLIAWAEMATAFPEDQKGAFALTVREGFGEADRAKLDALADTDLDFAALGRLASGDASPAPADTGGDDGDQPDPVTRHGFTPTGLVLDAASRVA